MATKNSVELQRIAEKINEHLRRLEKDPKFNKVDSKSRTSRFYGAGAYANRGSVSICYVAYQGSALYTRARAEAYLRWLDEGNKGTISDYEHLNPVIKEDNLAVIPAKEYRRKLEDVREHEYTGVIDAYYALLEVFSPAVPKRVGSSKYDAPIVPRTDDENFQHTGHFPSFHIMSTEQRKAANTLHDEIREAVRLAYERGLDHGRDIVGQAARGEITLHEINKRVVPAKPKRRKFYGGDE